MIEYLKIRDVKDPVRNEGAVGFVDAGIDFHIPEFSESYASELEALNIKGFVVSETADTPSMFIAKNTIFKIPLGVKVKFSFDVAMRAGNKSGVATKQYVVYGADTIDAAYQGEWIFNGIALKDTVLKFGQKIIQFVPEKIDTTKLTQFTGKEEDFFETKTLRGSGGFGSTGIGV